MNLLPFIIAYLIAPALVIAVCYLVAALTAILVPVFILIFALWVVLKLLRKVACGGRKVKSFPSDFDPKTGPAAQSARDFQSYSREVNRKYLRERLRYLP